MSRPNLAGEQPPRTDPPVVVACSGGGALHVRQKDVLRSSDGRDYLGGKRGDVISGKDGNTNSLELFTTGGVEGDLSGGFGDDIFGDGSGDNDTCSALKALSSSRRIGARTEYVAGAPLLALQR